MSAAQGTKQRGILPELQLAQIWKYIPAQTSYRARKLIPDPWQISKVDTGRLH